MEAMKKKRAKENQMKKIDIHIQILILGIYIKISDEEEQ